MAPTLDIVIRRHLDPGKLSPLTEEEASAEDGMMLNHHYEDMRGFSLDDLEDVLRGEGELLARVQTLTPDADELIDLLDEYTTESEFALDPGVAGAVAAISFAGGTPITSCNGGWFLDDHSSQVPTVLFSIRPDQIAPIQAAAEAADCGLENNGRHAELYADELAKLHHFAMHILKEGRFT